MKFTLIVLESCGLAVLLGVFAICGFYAFENNSLAGISLASALMLGSGIGLFNNLKSISSPYGLIFIFSILGFFLAHLNLNKPFLTAEFVAIALPVSVVYLILKISHLGRGKFKRAH